MDGKYYNLWSTDNDRTDANDEVVIKSVYDPSPVGYSLPASNAFTGFTTTGGTLYNQPDLFNVKGDFDKGYYFYTKPNNTGNTFFFQASGWRYDNYGSVSDGSMYGSCYVAGPNGTESGRYMDFRSFFVNPIGNDDRSWAFAVRSAEEKVLKCGLKKLQIACSFGENCNITTLKIRILLYTKTYFVHFLSSLY